MTKNLKKFTAGIFYIFFGSKIAIYLKDAQVTGEAFNPQKRTSSTLKHFECGSGLDSATQIHADPDPQPCFILCALAL
jgi:hypothetical protein